MNRFLRNVLMVIGLGMLLGLSGCWVSAGSGGGFVAVGPADGHGPPPHAPAHGYRAKHRYSYYPDVRVYFDAGRGRYFYPDGSAWRVSVSLPDRFRIRLGTPVIIDMDSGRPYLKNRDHVRKYPPSRMKKKGRGKKHHKKWK
jgi:hypothetical protein